MKISNSLKYMIKDLVEDDDVSESQLQSRIYDVIEILNPRKYTEEQKYEIYWQELASDDEKDNVSAHEWWEDDN